MFSLEERRGYLRLKASYYSLDSLKPIAYVGVRQQHYNYSVATKMAFAPINEAEEAGLAIIQNHNYHIRFSIIQREGLSNLQVVSCEGGIDKVQAIVKLEVDSVRLQIQGEEQKLYFYYSKNNEAYSLLVGEIDAKSLSTEMAGGFVGCTIGMFCTSNHGKVGNYAEFQWLEYMPKCLG